MRKLRVSKTFIKEFSSALREGEIWEESKRPKSLHRKGQSCLAGHRGTDRTLKPKVINTITSRHPMGKGKTNQRFPPNK